MSRDLEIVLAVLDGQPVKEVAKKYSLSRTRIQHIIQKQLAMADTRARVSGTLEEERQTYYTYIRSRHEWSTAECIKHAEALKRLLNAANKT